MPNAIPESRDFEVRSLSPFGLEITAREGLYDFDAWRSSYPKQISQLIRRESLLILHGFGRFSDEMTQLIAAPTSSGSTKVFHADNQGIPFALAWQTTGPSRTDTAFVRPEPLREALLDNLPALSRALPQIPQQKFIPFAASFHKLIDESLKKPDEMDPNDFHTHFRSLVRYRALGKLIVSDESFVSKAWLKLSAKAREKKDRLAQEEQDAEDVFAAVSPFMDSVNEQLKPETYFHSWKEFPYSTVVACNRHDDRDRVEHHTAFHRGVPDETASTKDSLIRCILSESNLERGKFTNFF